MSGQAQQRSSETGPSRYSFVDRLRNIQLDSSRRASALTGIAGRRASSSRKESRDGLRPESRSESPSVRRQGSRSPDLHKNDEDTPFAQRGAARVAAKPLSAQPVGKVTSASGRCSPGVTSAAPTTGSTGSAGASRLRLAPSRTPSRPPSAAQPGQAVRGAHKAPERCSSPSPVPTGHGSLHPSPTRGSPTRGSPFKPVHEPSCKVAITLMTRKPHRFDWWLRYHISLGVYHIFVHAEDTPELLPLLDSPEFRDYVTVTTGCDNSVDTHKVVSKDNYYTLMQRQEVQVRRSVKAARQMGIHWIFHIDDDELLHFKEPFSRLAHELPSEVSCIVLINVEAAPKRLHTDCVFTDTDTFSQHLMLAYRNGKSAGRVAVADWHGPHRFTGSYHVVPVDRACVLHFESCTYEQWRNKFIKHRDLGEQKKKDIPFPFYRDSISLFQDDPDGGVDEKRWKDFYQQRKIDHFNGLAEGQKMKIRLSDAPKEMVDWPVESISSYFDWRR